MQATDQGAIEGVMDAVSDRSGSHRRVRAIDQRAIEGAMDDASDGSGSHRWIDGCR